MALNLQVAQKGTRCLKSISRTFGSKQMAAILAEKPIESSIINKLTQEFSPTHLQVLNESNMHNVPKGSETHFKVIIVSDKFENTALLKRHRMVNETLKEEMKNSIHALSIERFSKKHFSTLELAAAIVEAYTDGILDDIPLNAPARSFGGVICKQTVCLNPAFRLLALVLLKAVDVVFENVENSVNRGKVALNKFVESIQSLGSAWLWCLFSDQDDYLSEALACTLNVYSQLPNRDPLGLLLEPNKTFYSILTNLSFDHTIILDWITSDETCFLEYFVKFLKFFISNKNDKLHCTLLHLVDYSSSSGSDEEDQLAHVEIPSIAIASFCKTLYISINKLYKRNLFPFNAQPLLKLLEEAQ